jgi:hypothetical protein
MNEDLRYFDPDTHRMQSASKLFDLTPAEQARSLVKHIELTITSHPKDEQIDEYERLIVAAISSAVEKSQVAVRSDCAAACASKAEAWENEAKQTNNEGAKRWAVGARECEKAIRAS